MSFQSPILLLGLLAVPSLIAIYLSSQRRRRAYAVRFTNLALLGQVMGKGPGVRRHLPPALFLLGVAGLILALARPQAVISVPRERASVILALDVSGSMAADDVQPSRLQAAERAARTLIDQLPGQARVGLVTFSSAPGIVLPLTRDHGSVEDALGDLQAGGGTAIGDALDASVKQLQATAEPAGSKTRTPAMIVLLTDGTSNLGMPPVDAAVEAKAAGIPVETVGIGARGQSTFLGGRLIDAVDETTLQAIASATGGKYFYAADEGQLRSIYSSLGSRIGWITEKIDVTAEVLGAGLVILVVGGLLSLRWFRLLP
jgi:Ca-activated chloride channel family protein